MPEMLKIILLLLSLSMPCILIEGSPGIRQTKGIMGIKNQHIKKRDYDIFEVYACPLDILLSGKKKRSVSAVAAAFVSAYYWLNSYVPYGNRHTYIKIGELCYDWRGKDSLFRNGPPTHEKCDMSEIDRCNRKYRGYTRCAHRISSFEDAWMRRGHWYDFLAWNCQRYTDSMKRFLQYCPWSARRAII